VNRRRFLLVSTGGIATLAGCGFNSSTPAEYEFALGSHNGSLYDCGGHAFRLTGSESRLRIEGQLPPKDTTCYNTSAEVYWGPEGQTLTAEVRTKKKGLLSECTSSSRPIQYTLTTPVGISGYSRFVLQHLHEGEVQYRYSRDTAKIVPPVEQADC
jgi:hypothetical protein